MVGGIATFLPGLIDFSKRWLLSALAAGAAICVFV
jgi:hypothetical protein